MIMKERITREVENEPRVSGKQFLAEIQEMIEKSCQREEILINGRPAIVINPSRIVKK